ncbi:hypothetical protein [Neobacillus niacini]|uniref:hypothetical protein n=1 Tax=Neobacillus niacini TaxID=86668 RepID=UPI00203CFF6F|nr:hypothetical protein [Neobacillus niacini]MCM3693084.1 hypothetical protein [Neobacillus niacini]
MHELSETPQERSCEEAHLRARGKHSAWSANQQPSLTQALKKEPNGAFASALVLEGVHKNVCRMQFLK